MSDNLQYFPPWALLYSKGILYRINNPVIRKIDKVGSPDAKITFDYLGKDEHHRIFRLTYTGWSGAGEGITYQVLVKADVESREILEHTLSFLNINTGVNYYLKSKIRNTKVKHIFMGSSDQTIWHVPYELEYRIKEKDGTEVNLMMSNIDLRSIFTENDITTLELMLKDTNDPNRVDNSINEVLRILENFAREAIMRGKLE